MREQYLNMWTLKFKDSVQETKFCQLREDMFRSNMLCVFVVWIFIVLIQAIIIPQCTVLVVCLAVSTFLLTSGSILVMAEEFEGLPRILQKSSATLVHHRNRRTIFVCVVVILMATASTIGLMLCPLNRTTCTNCEGDYNVFREITPAYQTSDINLNVFLTVHHNITINSDQPIDIRNQSKRSLTELENKTGNFLLNSILNVPVGDLIDANYTIESEDESPCAHPEYVVFTWVLCLIALATALKLYYLVKTFMAIAMVGTYALLIIVVFPDVFSSSDLEFEQSMVGMPLSAQMIILLAVFLSMVTYHARLVEVTSRLDFIWKETAERELTNMKSNRVLNDLLIKNILPDHVAAYYLSDEGKDELYAQMHNMCGVMFASIPNFKDFYSEDIENGKACLRILNEIICDFDALLEEQLFQSVEKIKTVGATYMAASGLNPKHHSEMGRSGEDIVCDLVEFAMAMRQKLQEVNKDAFNTFQLRVGISSGSLVSGVIGARKPVYDIWGNTVNVASRMDSTGENWKIQVPDYTAHLLQNKGYTCVVS